MKPNASALNPLMQNQALKDWRSLRHLAQHEGLFDRQTVAWLAMLVTGGCVLLLG